MSADLCWQIIRDNHSYLMRRRGAKKPFSLEPMNLKNVHSPRYSGLCPKAAMGIEPAPGGKGIVLTYKAKKYQNKPAKNLIKSTIKSGPRRSLQSIKNFVKANRYRNDLKMAALRRASAIFRSQRSQPFRKYRRHRRGNRVVKKTE